MHIHLEGYYRGGPSGFRQIAPGVYDINDEALYGCGQYLVDTGHATVIPDRPKGRGKQAKTSAPDADAAENSAQAENSLPDSKDDE